MNDPVENVVLLHGYAENPAKVWFPWLHACLEERGIRVWAPSLPDPLKPDFKAWFRTIEARAAKWNGSTVVIGHSLGGVLALRALEHAAKKPVRALMTVGSPFAATVNVQIYVDFFGERIDWDKLRRSAGKFVCFQSKNDPLVPYDHVFRYQETLGAKVVLTEKDGHFNEKKVPLLLKELERLLPKK